MATVKITDLPYITSIQPNTANTILVGVDIPLNYTGQMTLTTLAQGLYSNNNLKVGNNDIIYAGSVGQFTGNSASYLQVAIRNQQGSGSSDLVATADDGNDGTHYIDMGINGSTYNDPTFSATKAHDGYLYVQSNEPQGNLILGTASSNARINFVVGGIQSQNIVSYITTSGIFSPSINSLVAANVATLRSEITANATSANSVINTNISANVATLRGEISSNVSTINGSITANAASANSVINTRITANIATANLFTQAAFDKANNALANTTGTFGGNLTISGNVTVVGQTSSTGPITTGNLIVNGTTSLSGNVVMNATTYMTGVVTVNSTMVLANSNFNATEAAMTITASETVATPVNDGYMIHISGKNGIPARIITDSYGTGAYSVYASRTARGTPASPSAVQLNDTIGRFAASGYGTTKFQTLGTGRIDFIAAENYTDSKTGSIIKFWNCPIGTNTLTNIATFNGDSAVFTGIVNPQKGLVLSPNVVSGVTNTLNIDIANNSLYKVTIDNTATVNLSGYQTGKIVEVWMTNSSGTNRAVTHGCLANNSTVNGTSFTLKATSSAYLKYFSINGDNVNTFVSIVFS
jgi:hypothetical protein